MTDRLALVTGSTGFIGSKLTRHLLQAGWRVRVTLRATSRADRLGDLRCERVVVDVASGDTTSLDEALADVTHVFHVAGLVSGTPAALDQVNRAGTEFLAAHAARSPSPPVFVLVSSAAAGGPSRESQLRKPSDPPAPISNYGRSKLRGELAALRYVPPLPLTIVRPGIVFGEGDREFINIFRAMLRLRINAMIGPGTQPLGMIEIDDLCRLLILAAEQGKRVAARDAQGHPADGGGIYNAADPRPLSLVEVGEIVRQMPGQRRIRNLHLPAGIGYVVGGVSEFAGRLARRKTTLSRDKITEATATGWAIDPEKTISELGWAPRQSIDAHVRDACQIAIDERTR